MFDDPQKELKRLEEQLLKDEMNDDEFERFYHEIFEEFGAGEERERPRAVASNAKSGAYKDTPRAVAPKKKRKGVRGLLIFICLELLGIAAVVLWWVQRLL